MIKVTIRGEFIEKKLCVIKDEFPKVGEFESDSTNLNIVKCTQSALLSNLSYQLILRKSDNLLISVTLTMIRLAAVPGVRWWTSNTRELLEEWSRKQYSGRAFNL